MAQLFPMLDAQRSGHLPTTGGHAIYYEDCGNPAGLPVVFLHGGPGSCINSNHRRYFDPEIYRVILFDQRGCGRSLPRGALAQNTTPDLVADMECLRVHLDVDRWVLFGGSWGSTLALSYAIEHGARVLGMVLRGVFLASKPELRWYCEDLRAFVPESWARLTAGIEPPRTAAILSHYAVALAGPGAREAARAWNAYENAIMAIGEATGGTGGVVDTEAAIDRARVQLHYLAQGCFLSRPLLDQADLLTQPTIIVQGRRDLVCPPITAQALHARMPASELVMVEDGGHSAMHPAMIDALVRATGVMAGRLQERP